MAFLWLLLRVRAATTSLVLKKHPLPHAEPSPSWQNHQPALCVVSVKKQQVHLKRHFFFSSLSCSPHEEKVALPLHRSGTSSPPWAPQPPVAQINWRWLSAPWQNYSSWLPRDLLRYCTASHKAPGNEYIQTYSHPSQPFPLHTPALSLLLRSWFVSLGGRTLLTPHLSQEELSP